MEEKVSKMMSSQLKGSSKKFDLFITDKIQIMGGSEAAHVCKNHPYHDQKQGVCASCLRERLSRLFSVNPVLMVERPSCSSTLSCSPDDTAYYSSASSSKRRDLRHQRNVSDNMGSVSFRVSLGNRLKKSRSIAFASRNHAGEVKNGKKKNGFWTKLLHFNGKKDNVLRRSAVSMNERLY